MSRTTANHLFGMLHDTERAAPAALFETLHGRFAQHAQALLTHVNKEAAC